MKCGDKATARQRLADRATGKLRLDQFVKPFSGLEKQALRKLDMLRHAPDVGDLRAAPANWLEALGRPRRAQRMSKSSITTDGGATPVRVTTHPGEVLGEEFLKPLGLSVNALAIALCVPATRIGSIVKGERAVTADTALRLARYFGTSAEMWTGLQADYDLRLARYEKQKQIERDVEPLAVFAPALT